MSRPLSLFSDYGAKENHTTNFCGLILKLLYQDNPQAFSTVLGEITDSPVEIGVQFVQQKRLSGAVPDLVIAQESLQIFIETKNQSAQFDTAQLIRHLKAMPVGGSGLVLLALAKFDSESYREDFTARHAKVFAEASRRNIRVAALSFDDLLAALRGAETTPAFKEYLADFSGYLDRHDCLATWRHLLDVVNVGRTIEEFSKQSAYFCEHGPRQYSHRNARFLGAYQNMAVRYVAELEGVVLLPHRGETMTVLHGSRRPNAKLIALAKTAWSKAFDWRKDQADKIPLKMFVLGEPFPTEFRKDTPGGLQGSKIYFEAIAKTLNAETSADLAAKLQGRKWSEFR